MYKRIVFRIGLFGTIAIVLLIILIWKNEDRIIKSLVEQANASLVHPIEIGQCELGWLRTFPNLTMLAKDIRIPDKYENPFLRADKLVIKIPFKALFKNDVKVKSVSLISGILSIEEGQKEGSNYNIFTPSSKSSENLLVLENLALSNIMIEYRDKKDGNFAKFQIKESKSRVTLGQDLIGVKIQATALNHQMNINKVDYFLNSPIQINGQFNFAPSKKTIQFNDLNLTVDQVPLKMNGRIAFEENGSQFNLLFKGSKVPVDQLLHITPPIFLEELPTTVEHGRLSFNGDIKGLLNRSKYPHVHINYQLSDADIAYDHLAFTKVTGRGTFNNGKKNNISTSLLSLDTFYCKFFGEKLKGKLAINSFDPFTCESNVSGEVPLYAIEPFFSDSTLLVKDGALSFDNLSLSNNGIPIKSGQLNLADHDFKYKANEYTISEATLKFTDNNALIESMDLSLNQQNLSIYGNISDLDRILEKKPAIQCELTVHANELDLDKLSSSFLSKGPKLVNVSSTSRDKNTIKILGEIDHEIAKLQYQGIILTNLTGKLKLGEHTYQYDEKAELADGTISTKGSLTKQYQSYKLDGLFNSKRVDIKTLFLLFNDFSQDFITSAHLKGDLDSRVVYHIPMDHSGKVRLDLMDIFGKVTIRKGGLKNFDLLQTFSPYIKGEDLRNVRFQKLENYFAIKNEHIFLPVMNVHSNAANLTINGAHSFQNEMDYNLKIDAANVLANKLGIKRKKINKEGRINLYYSIVGNPENLDYDRNKRRVLKSFRITEDLKEDILRRLQNAQSN